MSDGGNQDDIQPTSSSGTERPVLVETLSPDDDEEEPSGSGEEPGTSQEPAEEQKEQAQEQSEQTSSDERGETLTEPPTELEPNGTSPSVPRGSTSAQAGGQGESANPNSWLHGPGRGEDVPRAGDLAVRGRQDQ